MANPLKSLIKGSALVGTSEVLTNACTLLRNMILARILSRDDFGVAASLSIVISLLELSSRMSFGQQIVQYRDGEEQSFLNSVHFLQAAMGIISAALILLLSHPSSLYLNIVDYAWAIQLLAFIPLSIGLSSLDIHRRVRNMQFGPLVALEAIPQIVTTLAAWPLAHYFGDYRAILSLLLSKAFLSLIVSHLLSQRTFSLYPNVAYFKDIFRFSTPLLISSFLLFAIFQGDLMLVAGAFSLSDLGGYSVAATIAMAPCIFLFKISGTVGLPFLAQVQNQPVEFFKRYSAFVQVLALLSAIFVGSTILVGEELIVILFGPKYAGTGVLLALLSTAQAIRILRAAPTTASVATGDTFNLFHSNLFRLIGLGIGVAVIFFHKDLYWIAGAGIIGEFIALGASAVRLKARRTISLGSLLYPAETFLGLIILPLIFLVFVAPTSHIRWIMLPLFWIISGVLFLILFRSSREAVLSLLIDFRFKKSVALLKRIPKFSGQI